MRESEKQNESFWREKDKDLWDVGAKKCKRLLFVWFNLLYCVDSLNSWLKWARVRACERERERERETEGVQSATCFSPFAKQFISVRKQNFLRVTDLSSSQSQLQTYNKYQSEWRPAHRLAVCLPPTNVVQDTQRSRQMSADVVLLFMHARKHACMPTEQKQEWNWTGPSFHASDIGSWISM